MDNKCATNYSIEEFVKMFKVIKEREMATAANIGAHRYIDFSMYNDECTIYNFFKLDDVEMDDENSIYVDSGHFYLSIDLNTCLSFTIDGSYDNTHFDINDHKGNKYSFVILSI